jgi:F-type H+-transporting ATPase subunit a
MSVENHTLFFALCAHGVGILLACIIRYLFNYKKINSFGYQLIYVASYSLYNFLQETIGQKKVSFALFSGFFFLSFVLLLYNLLVLIPFMEEATQDLNVTLALALFSFCLVHFHSFKLNSKIYMHHWIKKPINYVTSIGFKVFILNGLISILNFLVTLCLLPLELLSRFSLVLSLSFRLYGNIFGGAMISYLLKSFMMQSWIYQSMGTFSGLQLLVMMFFGLIEGSIQTFIFVLISINNIGLLIAED